MNELQVIYNQEVLGKDFHIYGTVEEPLFLAKDVAEWIEYSKRSDGSYQVGQMLKTVDEDEKIIAVNNVNGGREQWFLTEDGLYELKEFTNEHFSSTQTLVTPKGRETFRLLLEKNKLM